MPNANNITPDILVKYLRANGYTERIKGGHYIFSKPGMTRPIVFQTHVRPIPKHVISTILHAIGISKKELEIILQSY